MMLLQISGPRPGVEMRLAQIMQWISHSQNPGSPDSWLCTLPCTENFSVACNFAYPLPSSLVGWFRL